MLSPKHSDTMIETINKRSQTTKKPEIVILKNNAQLDVIFTDFKKVFDLVNYDTLIKILIATGFGESWFRSFLSNRYLESRYLVFILMFSLSLLVFHNEALVSNIILLICQ